MTAGAAALELLFVTVTLGWRSIWQRRQTGDLGLRLRRGISGPARVASAAMGIGMVMTVASPLLELAGVLGRVRSFDHGASRGAGLAAAALSVGVVARAQVDLRDSWRIGVDPNEHTELVVDGLLARVRNPIFTGMVANAIGVAFAVPNWVALVAPVLVLTGVELQVRGVEEPYLRSHHGESFDAYARRVGRFVPGVGRYARSRPAGQ